MLTIRPEQMKTLSEVETRRFEDRVIMDLQASLSDQVGVIPEPELRATIRRSLDDAFKYDITDEVDVRRYIEYVVRYGADFDTSPKTSWATEILRNHELTGTDKMNQIDDYDLFLRSAR